MRQYPNSFLSLCREPIAFVPIVMSLTALTWVLSSIAMFGVVHEADEGAGTHIWQLLIAGQLPISAYFLIRRLMQSPWQTLSVLTLQIATVLVAVAPVYFLNL
jgi:hypothetical protein